LRRTLSDEDLASPGAQKLLLDALEQADTQIEVLSGYVERFHGADKRAAILEERVKQSRAADIMFAVGLGLGGVILGLVPSLWSNGPIGLIALAVGAVMIVGAIVARTVAS